MRALHVLQISASRILCSDIWAKQRTRCHSKFQACFIVFPTSCGNCVPKRGLCSTGVTQNLHQTDYLYKVLFSQCSHYLPLHFPIQCVELNEYFSRRFDDNVGCCATTILESQPAARVKFVDALVAQNYRPFCNTDSCSCWVRLPVYQNDDVQRRCVPVFLPVLSRNLRHFREDGVAARICREGGALVATHVLLRDINVDVPCCLCALAGPCLAAWQEFLRAPRKGLLGLCVHLMNCCKRSVIAPGRALAAQKNLVA